MENRPKVGLGVIICKDQKVLFGKRKNSLGEDTWCPPGGHLEFGESWEDCARRETKEEAGIEIKNVRFAEVTNTVFEKESKHYVTIFVVADFDDGEVTVMEPEKCELWDWFAWDDLPQPLLPTVQDLLKTKFNPFDIASN